MKKDTIVQFVSFETAVSTDEFRAQWKEYNKLVPGQTEFSLQQEVALCIQQNRQPVTGYQMFFSDNSNFSIREVPNAFFTIIRDAAGKVEALQLKQGAANMRLPKIE